MIRPLVLASVASACTAAYAQIENATPIAEIVRGSQVTLNGTVQRIADDDEFILSDRSGSIEVYLGPNRVPVTVGETVVVSGYVGDDEGPLDLCASSITRADGTLIRIANCDG